MDVYEKRIANDVSNRRYSSAREENVRETKEKEKEWERERGKGGEKERERKGGENERERGEGEIDGLTKRQARIKTHKQTHTLTKRQADRQAKQPREKM